jgi:hypothetical protein
MTTELDHPAVDIFREMAPGYPTPESADHFLRNNIPDHGSKLPDGWSGQTFIHFGKKYVVATSPLVTSQNNNFIKELRTYRFDDDKQTVPSEKLTRIVTEPTKRLAASKYIGRKSITAKPAGKKCLFCGKLISWGNKKTKYCSNACRTGEYRRRKEAVMS